MGQDEIGKDQQWKTVLRTNQHKRYYRSPVRPSCSAVPSTATVSVILPAGSDTIPKSAAAPPLSIFTAPFSLNSVNHLRRNALAFLSQTRFAM